MKKTFAILILIAIAISACSPSPTQSLVVPESAPTETLEAIVPTSTQTSIPTETQIPSPTSILLTPTLDVASLVTFTPAPPAQCPTPDDGKRLSMGYILQNPDSKPEQITNAIVDFLNNGGSLKAAYDGLDKGTEEIKAFVLDLTNDGRQELVLQRFPYLFIIGCDTNRYKVIYQIDNKDGEVYIYAIQDYNMNGLPEIIFRRDYLPFLLGPLQNMVVVPIYSYYFLEWSGKSFQNILATSDTIEDGLRVNSDNLLKIPAVTISGRSAVTDNDNKNPWEIADFDGNGLKDIRIIGGVPGFDGPTRQAILTLVWNGKEYIPAQIDYKSVYRIDVVRDADKTFLSGNYEQALSLYINAVKNERLLDWWDSFDKYENQFVARKRMQAYSYYRMLLTHSVQGNLDEAFSDYNTLQNQFSNDDETVSSYATMSTQFWDNYQSTQSITSACAQVISFVNAHPVVLEPFNSIMGGDYQSKDFCPIE